MNPREKILIGTIVGLALVVVAGFITNFTLIDHTSTQNQTPATPIIDIQEPTLSPKIEYAAITDSASQKSPLTVLFKKVESSVVQINTKVSTTNPNIIINGSPLESQSSRLGSGFVYDTQGHIITNNHVIDGAQIVDVRFVDGNIYSAKVIGTDPFNDVAVLQITDDFSEETLTPLPLANSADLEVGQQIIAIGNPFGLSNTMTTGIVSQIGRLLPNRDAGYSIPGVIQTDAAINPGNSGGPMLNLEGQVIGINTAIQSTTGEFSGIGFAVPSNTIKRLVPALIQDGKYLHPWLGVSGTSLTPDIAKQIGLAKNYHGVFVTSVIPDSPAQKAGLQEATYNAERVLRGGDVIIALDGKMVRDIDDLIIYLAENKLVGDTVSIQINRAGELVELSASLASRPAN
ncbi:S1C family serine protease [Candidatus Nitrosotenuis cloacae]|uniref:Trypsin n=1 Tax=Candidatus Nitrosotenuis cloacae TaxID=1603555 RepID=A0A3G1AYY4_9ARCH|nr:trypsin-like peptidase domain-containing protein [Candidatus Nitrosotenuis cloacae]AJZ75108.1 trypsin [Candidatus Nitrosotenuis cloacae]